MFVTEIRDSNDLLAAIGEKIVIYFHRLIFILLYAYMFMLCVDMYKSDMLHRVIYKLLKYQRLHPALLRLCLLCKMGNIPLN